jgi:hypothetical protein
MRYGPIADVSLERSVRIIARALFVERLKCAAIAKALRLVGPNLAPAMADYIHDAILQMQLSEPPIDADPVVR